MCWWPAWQLSLTDTHTCTHIQGLVGLEPWIECATQFVQTPNRFELCWRGRKPTFYFNAESCPSCSDRIFSCYDISFSYLFCRAIEKWIKIIAATNHKMLISLSSTWWTIFINELKTKELFQKRVECNWLFTMSPFIVYEIYIISRPQNNAPSLAKDINANLLSFGKTKINLIIFMKDK